MTKKPVIFSDFDGTITDRDVIMMIMEAFAPPEWKTIVDQILNQRTLSIREGVQQLFNLIASDRREELIAFVRQNVTLRPGFPEFLAFCKQHEIPFLVVSGGVDFFIQPILEPYRHQLEIFCNTGVFNATTIGLELPYLDESCTPCGQCACCKIAIMDRYPGDTHTRIAIGDSLTDLGMAKAADLVYARARLIEYAEESDVNVTPFETFHDIQRHLEQHLKEIAHVQPA